MKVKSIIIGIIEVLVVVYAIAVIAIVMNENEYGYKHLGSTTFVPVNKENVGDFTDAKVGELLLIEDTSYVDINEGDTIYYYSTAKNEYIVIDDKVTYKEGNNREALYKFSSNEDVVIDGKRVIGKLKKKNNLGKVFSAITSSLGQLFSVILPILIVFVYQIFNFISLLKEKDEEEVVKK